LQKTLQNKTNSLRSIEILKEFADKDNSKCEDDDESEEIVSDEEAGSDKERLLLFVPPLLLFIPLRPELRKIWPSNITC
jgi:hypothetical protein